MEINWNELYRKLANDLLDSKCEVDGVRDTLRWLIGDNPNQPDYSKEELLALHFDEDDIDEVLAEMKGED